MVQVCQHLCSAVMSDPHTDSLCGHRWITLCDAVLFNRVCNEFNELLLALDESTESYYRPQGLRMPYFNPPPRPLSLFYALFFIIQNTIQENICVYEQSIYFCVFFNWPKD